jgi:hypothetical protein
LILIVVNADAAQERKFPGTAMLLHGMHLAWAAGVTPGHPEARGLFYSVGFRELSRDAPLIKTKTAS